MRRDSDSSAGCSLKHLVLHFFAARVVFGGDETLQNLLLAVVQGRTTLKLLVPRGRVHFQEHGTLILTHPLLFYSETMHQFPASLVLAAIVSGDQVRGNLVQRFDLLQMRGPYLVPGLPVPALVLLPLPRLPPAPSHTRVRSPPRCSSRTQRRWGA
jgi:hypothetical protein